MTPTNVVRLGRWTSADLGGMVDGLNLYCYVRNNPVNGVDEMGYAAIEPEKKKEVEVEGSAAMDNTDIAEGDASIELGDPPSHLVNTNFELLGLNNNFSEYNYDLNDNLKTIGKYRIYEAFNSNRPSRTVGYFAVRVFRSIEASQASPNAKALEAHPEWFIHLHGLEEFKEAEETNWSYKIPSNAAWTIHEGGFTQAEKDYLNGNGSASAVILSGWKSLQSIQGWVFAIGASLMAFSVSQGKGNTKIDDLDALLLDYRKTLGKEGGGAIKSNLSVIEYRKDGQYNYVITQSLHAEKYGMAYVLGVEGISAENIIRLHSELQPCTSCGPKINTMLPKTEVTYKFPYYKQPGSRSYTGKDAHDKHIDNIFK